MTTEDMFAFPPSFAQQRLWILEQLQPGSAIYNIPWTIEIKGSVAVPALQQALQALVDRHEALRTTFAVVDGTPVQVVAETLPIAVPAVDLAQYAPGEREAEAQRLIMAEAQRPFDLVAGPLLRGLLIQRAADDHVLLLTMHHLIFDAWSRDVFFQELATLYAACARSADPMRALPALPIQYADYAVWQREWLAGEVLEQQLSYWKRQLGPEGAPAPALTELPSDRSRPTVQTFRGAQHALSVPPSVQAALATLSQQAGVTLFMTLLAAFKTLLYHYTNQPDIVVGSPIANRPRPETAGLIGFFVNMLVLRSNLSGDPTFREVLARVRETALGAYAHQELPFEKLVEELAPDRSLNYTPLFQIVFSLHSAAAAVKESAGLELRIGDVSNGSSKFDLTLNMVEAESGLSGVFVYNPDLFDAATIERMAGHFTTLLAQVAVQPDTHVSRLSLLTSEERQHLLPPVMVSVADRPLVPELVAGWAARTPEALALTAGTERLTYRQLEAQANQLAHLLRGLALPPEAVVALLLPRSVDWIVAQLAVLRAGYAFLPLDPDAPVARLRLQLATANTALVLSTTTALPPDLAATCPVRCLDDMAEELVTLPTTPPPVPLHPAQLAYVIFTSGSTGVPKGVAVPHRGLASLVVWHHQAYAVTPADRASQVAAQTFDAAVWEVWPYLTAGASLHLADEATRRDPGALGRWLATAAISLSFVPTALAEALWTGGWRAPATLRALLVGGDQLHPVDTTRLGCALSNHYGPTEAAVVATAGRVAAGGGLPPIGVALPDVQAYVLNRWGQPVPVGVVGELYLGGASLARGYLHQAGGTAEKFVPDPFSGQPGARLYRTGDLVRWRTDGQLAFIGRRDGQVQLRGLRIELGEIEAVLQAHAEVAEAVVIAHETAPNTKRLVAFVVLQGIDDVTSDDLRGFLRERLPQYMIPASIVLLEGMPLTPNGKIDRRALDERALMESGELVYVGPRTPVEAQLAAIWQQLLRPTNPAPIGIHDNFFALGGHSLLATQVMSRVRDTFKVELLLRTLFEHPTIAELAAVIQPAEKIAAATATSDLRPARRDGAMPLSFTQQRLWFLNQMQPDSSFYNIVIAIRMDGRLNVAALEQSLIAIVQRHEILRTTFQLVDGQPAQVIASAHRLSLPVQDVQAPDTAAGEAKIKQFVEHEAQRPFDLAHGPLIRAYLLRQNPEQHTFCLSVHHIVWDGWSLGVFYRELSALYEVYSTAAAYEIPDRLTAALPPLGTQYADFAIWQRDYLQGAVLEQQLSYWKQQLAGVPPHIDLPTDRPRPAVQTFHGAEQAIVLPAALTAALTSLSQQEGVTLFMTLLTAFKIVLQRYTAQSDIVIGVPIANRNRSEIEGLIGCFVNTLVLRTDLSGNLSFRELLRRVRETALGAYAHQDLPFEKLVEELRPERDLSRTPLVQITFQLLSRASSSFELTGLDVRSMGFAINSAKFDLELQMIEAGGEIIAAAVYNTDLFEEATILRLLRHLEIVLGAAVTNPERRLSDLPLLTEAERRLMLHDWNATAHTLPAETTIVEAFEAQVGRTPDAIAVAYAVSSVTFGELNAQANRLAHHLRRLGVGPDVIVGLCVERSVAMLVGLLGILKAGGAYLPLDPSYPVERLRFMLADTAAPVLVTHGRLSDDLQLRAEHVVRLDSTALDSYPASDPPHSATARNLAYIIYTSGSTGRPKGVQIEQRSVLNLLTGLRETIYAEYGASKRQLRIGLNASIAFDSSVKQLIQLLDGHTLDVLPEALRRDNQAFVAYLREREIQVLDCTPTLLQTLLEAGLPSETRLERLLIGGEQIGGDLWGVLAAQGPPSAYNVYGPTECTVNATVCEIAAHAEPTIGRALANTRVYILDPQLNPVPVGVAGEIYLGGPSVARGYRSRPDLTAERFIPDPFTGEPGSRLYKTGDGGRYRADGRIEFLGRLDQQVKLRGFRIELGEIEAMLRQHSAVREALVLVREDQPGDKRLVAYVVGEQKNRVPSGRTREQRTKNIEQNEPANTTSVMILPSPAAAGEGLGGEGLTSSLRQYLKDQLPDYMLPNAYVLLDKFPLLPNGKLDRKALPAPDGARPELEHVYVAPQSQLERVIAGVWQSILGVNQVGLHDNFFDLGGHSLLMIQVQGKLQAILSKNVPLVDMFRYATIKDLAKHLHQDQAPSFEANRDRAKTRRESLMQQRQLRHNQQSSRRAQGVQDE